MTQGVRSSIFMIAVYAAFFASGAGCLIAEVTWNRMLIVVVGNSMSAAAMIIAVFMAGLGLGSQVGGRILAGRRSSLLPYVLLEAVIGIYVILSPTIFTQLSALFDSLAGSIDNQTGLAAVRIVVSTGALFLPAFLMGGTFPAMISGAALSNRTQRTARTGYLYSINTLGAAIGCFAAGYHLLFEFGVQATLNVALGMYAIAALCGIVAHRIKTAEPAEAAAAAPEDSTPSAAPPLRRFLYVATFGVGFVALAYEVLLTRLSILYLGNSVSVFPLVLTGFLFGTGVSAIVGTWLYGVLRRRTQSADKLFGIAALVAGALVMATPYLLLSDRVLGSTRLALLAEAVARNPIPILAIITAPTVFIGALLPVAIRMLNPESRGTATRAAATLYALNTAGGLVGASLANHFLVPLIGIQGTVVALASICVAIAAANLSSSSRSAVRWPVTAVGTAGVAVVLLASLPPMMELYAEKIADSTQAQSAEVLLIREGRAATITVIDQADPKHGSYRDVYLNGVEEASTRFWHTQLFKVLGILPVLVHESDRPKDAMVIAFGAGITAGSVLASPEVGTLDVVDLNPDIEEINDLFTEVNGDVFHEPRFNFINDDGRNYLVTCHKDYDLIIGDSTHPRAYDSWILYTEEFYRAAQARLRPGGIFAQWVPVLGSMQGDLFKIHLNTFRKVFPNCTFWYVYGSDQAFFMSTPEPLALNAERLQQKLDQLPGWFQADKYQIDTVVGLAGFFWMDEAAMARMAGTEARINTDDRHYFDKQAAVWPAPPQERLPAYQASVLPLFEGQDEALAASLRDEQTMAQLLARYGFFHDTESLFRAYCGRPENGNVRYWMSREFSSDLPHHESFCGNAEIRSYWAIVAQHPDHARSLNALADLLCAAGQPEAALPWAEKAAALEPRNGMILDTHGWVLFNLGRTAAALEVLNDADEHLPNHPIVLYHLGAANQAAGHDQVARRQLERALQIQGDFPFAREARRLLGQ